MLLQSFTRFPRLPIEIRCCVWRLALRQPRVHRLRIADVDHELPYTLLPTETLPRSTITTRTILATCQESRMEALHAVPDLLPLGESILHFNQHEDVICLVKVNLDVLRAVNEAASRAGENDGGDANVPSALQWLGKMTRLALEVRNTSFHADFGASLNGGAEVGHLSRFIAMCSKLEWLFLVALPSPDGMETVRCWKRRSTDIPVGDFDDENDDSEYELEYGELDYADDEGYEEEDRSEDANAASWKGGGIGSISGNWIRGENGLSDWYRWVPRRTTWAFSNEIVQTHFLEVATWKNSLQSVLQRQSDMLDMSNDQIPAQGTVRVEVMIHFREGIEPPSEL
ncbi:hypothetical protein QQS21_007285 [Conoideocrella luteorostrata]|uniref:2EXR domain-containing protein n=1 Tax=Conoideocrella luteorostrata TaxID=1105319 RepID=A0AAJ0CND6_9HYPO|nr:hypothetical protein QQS21_007285 [Conoideocrella luteorostrata]